MEIIEERARNLKLFYWRMLGYPGINLAKELINHFCHYHKFTFGKWVWQNIFFMPSHWMPIPKLPEE